MRSPTHSTHDRGYILPTTLVALAVLSLLGAAVLGWAQTGLRISNRAVQAEQAFYMANAGIEEAFARIAAFELPATLTRTTATGAFTATLTPGSDRIVTAVSTGRAGASTRQITARIRQPFKAIGNSYQAALVSNSSLTLAQRVTLCGDVLVGGDATFGTMLTVYTSTVKSPCPFVSGTGKLVVSGAATFQNNNNEIQGGWCDATRFGTGTPCPRKPEPPLMPPFTVADLRARATRLVLKDCTGQTLPCAPLGATGTWTLQGAQSYSGDLIWVDGDIEVATATVLGGTATFAATGEIRFLGSATAAAGCTTCAHAFVSYSNQSVASGVTVQGLFLAIGPTATFRWGDDATIWGGVVAQQIDGGKRATIIGYPASADPASLLPMLGSTSYRPAAILGWEE